MTPPVLFPDAQKVAIDYLRTVLDPALYIGVQVPSPRRPQMVTVRRDGGPRLDAVREAARLGVNVWGETDMAAALLAALVRAHLGASAGYGPILRASELAGPSPIVDEQPRYFLTVELVLRGTTLST